MTSSAWHVSVLVLAALAALAVSGCCCARAPSECTVQGQAAGVPDKATVSPEEIALESPQMAAHLMDLALLEAREQALATRLGEKSPELIELRQQIFVYRVLIRRYAEDWNARLGKPRRD